jgi:serine/threonine protein phosphatase PrpC
MIGPSHIRLGLPNQDAWISRSYSWGNVVVVSDGLGSRPKSDVGSKAVCKSVIEAAKHYHNCPEAQIDDVLGLIHSLWLMKISPFEPDECCATCLFVIRFNGKCLLAQLGDGLIAVCGNGDNESIFLNDSKQDSFSNLTFCLGHKFRPEQWKTSTIQSDQCQAVILCTDGISDDLLPNKQSEFAKEIYLSYRNYSSCQRINELHGWLKNWPVPGHSDDKTVACLFRKDSVTE